MNKDRYLVCHDHERRTCLKVNEIDHLTIYIPLMVEGGFRVEQTSTESFRQRYKPLPDYPVERCCQLYLSYCTTVGATEEVLDYLNQVIEITEEDRKMATAQQRALVKKNEMRKKKAGTEEPAVKKSKEETPKKVTSTRAKKRTASSSTTNESSGSYSSAAKMFQALIMAGELTDDEIFKQVQATFDLGDKKRSYVGWYRNKLKKDGENPPETK